jgi:hypothetical protein
MKALPSGREKGGFGSAADSGHGTGTANVFPEADSMTGRLGGKGLLEKSLETFIEILLSAPKERLEINLLIGKQATAQSSVGSQSQAITGTAEMAAHGTDES